MGLNHTYLGGAFSHHDNCKQNVPEVAHLSTVARAPWPKRFHDEELIGPGLLSSKIPFIGLGVSRKRQEDLVSVLGDQEKAMNGNHISMDSQNPASLYPEHTGC
jgi:hypothetical protein